MSQKYNTCIRLAVVVIGAGPVGLRTAIGMALLDAQVTYLRVKWVYNQSETYPVFQISA